MTKAPTSTTEYDYETLARMLSLAGDSTRLQILELLFSWQEGCVSSIADELDISVATASYHLNHMADNGYFSRDRDGQKVCYVLENNDFVACLQELLDKNLVQN
jgi:predicted transcriptional regulator